jgi:hypothetical protein
MSCSLVSGYQRFRRICYLHLPEEGLPDSTHAVSNLEGHIMNIYSFNCRLREET